MQRQNNIETDRKRGTERERIKDHIHSIRNKKVYWLKEET